MKFCKIKSYAKINFSLNVIGKKTSGLHKIESLVTFVKLCDIIYLRPIKSNKHKIKFYGKFGKNIKKNNTVYKLLKILDKKILLKNQKFEIIIKKNIPQKSGMGGGSMNAASIINFFIKKKIFTISKNELLKIINLIGSDIVLGIDPKNSILTSSGKLFKYKNKLNFNVLIVKPQFGCSTKSIYSKVKHFSKSKYNKPKRSLFNIKNIVTSSNALERIAINQYPKLKTLKIFLSKLPNVIFVRMTGSGSSIVAYFQSKKATVFASRIFKKKFKNYWYIISKTI